MPLSAANIVPGNVIKAVDVKQYFDLFTGTITDQPVTLANTLTVGGFQGVGSAPFRVSGVGAQTAQMVELRTLASDAQPVFSISRLGTMAWGPGGGTGIDVTLSRPGANQLIITGTPGTTVLTVANGLSVTVGNVGIGGAPSTVIGLVVSGSITVGAAQYGVYSSITSSSAAISETTGFYAQPQTAASAYTSAQVAGFHAGSPIKGAGSTITSAYGLLVDAITSGNTNNYGIYIGAPSGGATENLGLRNDGGATVCGASKGLGFFGNTALNGKQTVTGSRGANVALASLISALANYGLVTDSSS